MATFDANRYVKEFESAWNTKDPEPLMKWSAPDVEFQDPRSDRTTRGQSAIRESSKQWFDAFSEMKIELKQSTVSGNNVALLYRCAGRHTGELEMAPGERVPATNKPAVVDVAEFITLNNEGKIVRDVAIMDSAKLLMQLGLMPGTQAAGQRGTTKVAGR